MADNIKLKGKNTILAKEANCFVTLNNKRFNCFHFKNLEATLDINKTEMDVLHSFMKQHKVTGMVGKFKGEKYTVASEMRKAYKEMKDSGAIPVYDMQIVNEDKNSTCGRQEIWLYDCMDDSLVLSKLDSGDEILSESVEGTFDDWDMPASFDLWKELEA